LEKVLNSALAKNQWALFNQANQSKEKRKQMFSGT